MTIAYLGPIASFTSLVAQELFPENTLSPQSSIRDCFLAVQKGELDKAVVPLENSIEGTVSMTLDYLYDFEGISIEAEAVLPISHHLMVHPQSEEVQAIVSHPQALAQCFHSLDTDFKAVPRMDYHSTSGAAKYISEHPEKNFAAIANTTAAEMYGLQIIRHDIHDFEQNHTKFIVISKQNKTLDLPLVAAEEKSSLILTLPEDHAGGLHQALSVFAWRKMNLSKIESRTLKKKLGSYFFFINIVGEWNSAQALNAVQELESLNIQVSFLGHYKEYLIEG
ncbi:prephenate dehydratase [Chryseobacterium sp. A301]